MRDPRKDKEICDCDLSREENQALVTEAAPQVWRRDEQVHDLRTELSLQTLHQEHVTQHQSQEHAEPHHHLTRLVHETQQYQELFEESRAARSATGPEIERPRQREAELPRQARRARFDALCFRNRTNLEFHESKTSEYQQIFLDFRSEIMQLKASAAPPYFTRNIEASKKRDSKSSNRSTDNTRFTEQLGRSKPQLDSRCLL